MFYQKSIQDILKESDSSLEGLNELLNKIDDEYFEEVIVKGFVIGLYKTELKNKLKITVIQNYLFLSV